MSGCNKLCNQGRECTCCSGSQPGRTAAELLTDVVLFVLMLCALIFTVFSLLGFWSAA